MKKSLITLSGLALVVSGISGINNIALAKGKIPVEPKAQVDIQKVQDNTKLVAPAQKVEIQYTLDVTVKDIPKGQQTLFIPIKIDTMILDFDKVALEGLSAQNILAVASNSKDKVGTGIGLIKLDDTGLPETLSIKAILKPVGEGQTSISITKVSEGPSLPSKGLIINQDVKVTIDTPADIEVTESVVGTKKKLSLSQKKITLNIQRPAQKEETIFIPVIYNKSVVDIDETFGHTIISEGVSIKSFNGGALNEDGAGVEMVLSADAPKDFTVDLDLIARKAGISTLSIAFPQTGHTAIVSGPVVDIVPQVLTVANTK